MLADSVEAASRTLKKPTIARLEQFVRELVMDKFGHDQLSASELSFHDLDIIMNTFVRILAGHFHSRIEYPKIQGRCQMNQVSMDVQGVSEPVWLERAEKFILRVLDSLGHDHWDLSIVFCDDPFISNLNQEYRHKEGPTDVLSFDQGEWYEGENGRRYLAGDVVLSLDTSGPECP
jgi:hypothetical protein